MVLVSLLIGALIPPWGPTLMNLSKANYLPKFPYPNMVTLGVLELQYRNVEGSWFSPQQ